MAPLTDGNSSKNAKGKLPDKWRNISHKINKVTDKRNNSLKDDKEIEEKEEIVVLGKINFVVVYSSV